jgi:hypothetical protein
MQVLLAASDATPAGFMLTGMGDRPVNTLRLDWRKCFRVRCIDARRMTKRTCADPRAARRVGSDVVDDVIGVGRVAGDPAYPRQVIQLEDLANSPGDVVVCAGCVSAVDSDKPLGCPDPLLLEEASRLNEFAVLAFCAEITRPPAIGHRD